MKLKLNTKTGEIVEDTENPYVTALLVFAIVVSFLAFLSTLVPGVDEYVHMVLTGPDEIKKKTNA